MEFTIKSKHIEYPELLKSDLDGLTRHGKEVVDVEDNKLILGDSVKTYNFLLDKNNKQLREHFAAIGFGYVELNVQVKKIPLLGIETTKVKKPTRENANYLLIKSMSREKPDIYVESLHDYHEEKAKVFLPLTIIYAVLFAINIIMQSRVIKNLSIYGYYIISFIIMVLLVSTFYSYLRHKQFKEDLE